MSLHHAHVCTLRTDTCSGNMRTKNDSNFKYQLTIVSALDKVPPPTTHFSFNFLFPSLHLSVSFHWTHATSSALPHHLLLSSSIRPKERVFVKLLLVLHFPALSSLTCCRPESGTVHYLQEEREEKAYKYRETPASLKVTDSFPTFFFCLFNTKQDLLASLITQPAVERG